MFKDIIEKINSAEKIAIFTHINPDGDALGSAYGLKLALILMGKKAEVFLETDTPVTKEYRLVKGKEESPLKLSDCDLFVAVDCADFLRLGSRCENFSGETIAIDHHKTHQNFAKTTLVCPDASATGEIIFELIKKMGVSVSKEVAYNLYMAIVCDTGNFRYSSTTSKTHILAAELMEYGLDIADMAKRLFDTKSKEYLDIYKRSIERLEMYHDGKIALLWLSEKDFGEAGIKEADADAVVTLPSSVQGVEVGIYVRERKDGFKISLRSTGRADVTNIATAFGGGGHSKAAGFSMNLPIDQIKSQVVAETIKELERAKVGE